MAGRGSLIPRIGWAVLALALLVLVLTALYLAADAEGLGAGLARWYPFVFIGAAAALLLLAGAILQRLRRLRRALRERQAGARLNRRLLVLLLVLAIPPVLLVYGFSARFIGATVDSWLRANSAEILGEALRVGRALLDERRALAERDAASLAAELEGLDPLDWQSAIDRALDRFDAAQIALFSRDGRLLALAAAEPSLVIADPPPDELLLVLRESRRAVASEPAGEGLQLRALNAVGSGPGAAHLQILSRLPESYAQGLLRVEQGIAQARQAAFLRDSLKLAFVLILSFVLLLSVLLAVLLAFVLSRRLVAPIGQLATATARVSEGNYAVRLEELARDDELAFLISGFNRMLGDLDAASERARSSQAETERQRAYLETVLQRLSSAVLVVDDVGILRSANAAATELLGPPAVAGGALVDLGAASAQGSALASLVQSRLRDDSQEFGVELASDAADGRHLWLVRGARLPDGNLLVVVDDTTDIDRARRDAAWGEVARRLAHEVKNPLTPIQLAAERLRRRVLPHLQGAEADVLDRATHTIVAQVDALKTLVNAFSDYARAPVLQRRPVDLPALMGEVAELYAGDPRISLAVVANPGLPAVTADAGRLRQVLHNLVKNAQEAGAARIRLGAGLDADGSAVELVVEDDGPGLPEGFDTSWFEPYRSTKPKGTGLGLAIVRKIAEEHAGGLQAGRSGSLGGARFSLRLPLAPPSR
ncbi:sensor histidine kinase [Pseudomarimonas salicorniae]|uniref:histidine kinase n=1 Tax=Pseudomarimonas salicorniae TaxID=2933270 RepID=A0ABT0GKK8_9GAMM|nr:ATP-binding protein [Lysobacter sp. CAU 1642]MCK7595076.1 ATP-binding protein [Lysobacter sp. CAU 1642]